LEGALSEEEEERRIHNLPSWAPNEEMAWAWTMEYLYDFRWKLMDESGLEEEVEVEDELELAE